MTTSATRESDAVGRAAHAVPYAHYRGRSELDKIPHAAPRDAVQRDLRLLDAREEMHVLEVGTGAGYSAALLAELVGAKGHVVSLDIDASLVQRAVELHAQRGVRGIETVTADGHDGYPLRAPYDRVIGWAAPDVVPVAWAEQSSPGGIIVSAVHLAPLTGAVAMVRAVANADGDVSDVSLHRGTYPGMHPYPQDHPDSHIDASRNRAGEVVWVSSEGSRGGQAASAEDLLSALLSPRHEERAPHEDHDDVARRVASAHLVWRDLQYFLLASGTSNMVTCRLPGSDPLSLPASGVGLAFGSHFAVLTNDGRFLASGAKARPLAELHELFGKWADARRPGLESLSPRTRPVSGGWEVRVALAPG